MNPKTLEKLDMVRLRDQTCYLTLAKLNVSDYKKPTRYKITGTWCIDYGEDITPRYVPVPEMTDCEFNIKTVNITLFKHNHLITCTLNNTMDISLPVELVDVPSNNKGKVILKHVTFSGDVGNPYIITPINVPIEYLPLIEQGENGSKITNVFSNYISAPNNIYNNYYMSIEHHSASVHPKIYLGTLNLVEAEGQDYLKLEMFTISFMYPNNEIGIPID